MDLKLSLIKILARVPEKLFPGFLKKWLNRELKEIIAVEEMEINRSNWQLVQNYEELKTLVEDPRVPEEVREEFRLKLADFGKKLDRFQEDKAQLEAERKAKN